MFKFKLNLNIDHDLWQPKEWFIAKLSEEPELFKARVEPGSSSA